MIADAAAITGTSGNVSDAKSQTKAKKRSVFGAS
jgi:hypothetical protein